MTKTIHVCDRCEKEVSHLYKMPELHCERNVIYVSHSKIELCEECAKQACDEFNKFAERWITND